MSGSGGGRTCRWVEVQVGVGQLSDGRSCLISRLVSMSSCPEDEAADTSSTFSCSSSSSFLFLSLPLSPPPPSLSLSTSLSRPLSLPLYFSLSPPPLLSLPVFLLSCPFGNLEQLSRTSVQCSVWRLCITLSFKAVWTIVPVVRPPASPQCPPQTSVRPSGRPVWVVSCLHYPFHWFKL